MCQHLNKSLQLTEKLRLTFIAARKYLNSPFFESIMPPQFLLQEASNLKMFDSKQQRRFAK